MIVKKIAYGIWLTDEFGAAIEGVTDDDLEIVKPYRYEKVKGVINCPSVEYPQYVLGFLVQVDKNTDLGLLENLWKEEIEGAPLEIKELAYRLKNSGNQYLNTDIHFLAGHN